MSRRINHHDIASALAAEVAARGGDKTPREVITEMAGEIRDPAMEGITTLLLLQYDYPVGALAEAIEQHGVHGLDRFGRRRYFKADSPEAGAALNALAASYQAQAAWRRGLDTTDDILRPMALLACFGWPDDAQPDLGAPSPQPVPRASAETKRQDTLLRLVVVLAAEHGIDVTRASAAPDLARFFEDRGTKPPAPNTLKSIVARARDVADRFEIVTTATRPTR